MVIVENLASTLAASHRDILIPDLQRMIATPIRELRDDVHALLDAQAQDIRALQTEYQMIVAGLKRVEGQLDRVDGRLEKVEGRLGQAEAALGRIEAKVDKQVLRSELRELQAKVDGLQGQMRVLEARLEG
jgi:chromosome segregation ATPase